MTETCAICRRVIKKFLYKFNNVDIDKIYFQDIENEKAPAMAVYGVNSPQIKLLFEIYNVEVRYVVETNILKFDLLSDAQRSWMILGILGSIDPECGGKIMKEDFKSFNFIVDLMCQFNLDSDYLNRDDLPNLLKEDLDII